jgi:hypothetical protein
MTRMNTSDDTSIKEVPGVVVETTGGKLRGKCYLDCDISLSFSQAGSPPTPQCVLGIS